MTGWGSAIIHSPQHRVSEINHTRLVTQAARHGCGREAPGRRRHGCERRRPLHLGRVWRQRRYDLVEVVGRDLAVTAAAPPAADVATRSHARAAQRLQRCDGKGDAGRDCSACSDP